MRGTGPLTTPFRSVAAVCFREGWGRRGQRPPTLAIQRVPKIFDMKTTRRIAVKHSNLTGLSRVPLVPHGLLDCCARRNGRVLYRSQIDNVIEIRVAA